MSAEDNRKKLHTYIADLDDKKVLAMLTLFEDEIAYAPAVTLSEQEKEEIIRRDHDRISGKSKIYSLEDAQKMIRRKKA